MQDAREKFVFFFVSHIGCDEMFNKNYLKIVNWQSTENGRTLHTKHPHAI